MRNRLRAKLKKWMALCLAGTMALTFAGCSKNKKEPRPEPKTTAKIDKGNANAGGSGDGQADVPLMVGTSAFSREFNPFLAETEADRQAVELTQIRLVTNDRSGKIVYHGIDGELRSYQGEEYTYYGASDLSIQYDRQKDSTIYHIKLRDDLLFSDGQKLTADDVLFTLYVLCDKSYTGTEPIKDMPVKGLLNYQVNSSKAEGYTDKSLVKKIKKHRNKFSNWLKKHGYTSLAAQISAGKISSKKILDINDKDQALFYQARIYFSRGKGKKVRSISGIRKLGDYELSVELRGYNRRMSAALQIPICALHYYGDMTKFNPEEGRFGFRRGDISSVLANKSTPMGAGAYRFVKHEGEIVYYTSNELYFLGCPQIAYLQLKDMTETLEETRTNLAQKAAEEAVSQPEKQDAEASPMPSANPSAEVTEIKGGTVDVLKGTFRGEEQLSWIAGANSNQELDGNTVAANFVSDGNYRYLGIHGKNVAVGGQPGSNASKKLRRAIAVLFNGAKSMLKERDGVSVDLVPSPFGRQSWVNPEGDGREEEYKNIFEKNTSGEALYDEEDNTAARMEKAKSEALQAFRQAGFSVEGKKVTKAPQGASLRYHLWIAGGENNPLYDMAVHTAEAFQSIGMELIIDEAASAGELQKKLAGGTQQLWIGMRDVSDVDWQNRYGTDASGNFFGISDVALDAGLAKLQSYLVSKQRIEIYQKCMDSLFEWAVEVPLCEYRDAVLFSSARVKKGTIPADITPFYSWMNEVQKIQMK